MKNHPFSKSNQPYVLLKGLFLLQENPSPTYLLRIPTDGAIVGSFETFSQDIVYCYKGDKEVKRGQTASVASVYVEDIHRGKGYATTMLTQFLQMQREKKGIPLKEKKSKYKLFYAEYICSELYSDVKPSLYARIGFSAFPATIVAVHVKNFAASPHFSPSCTTPMKESDVERVSRKKREIVDGMTK